jgi:hypothetical protein
LVDRLKNAGDEINYVPDDVNVATTLLELEINVPKIGLKADFTCAF